MPKLFLGTREVTPAIYKDAGVKYNATIDNFLGDINSNGVLQRPTGNFDLIFPGVTDIAERALSNKFNYSRVKNISFPDLVRISGNYALFSAFYSASITSVSFPLLETVSGTQSLGQAFEYSGILTCTFPKLSSITGNSAMNRCFAYNSSLTDVYFPALKTTSFGSDYTNQFTNMLSGTGSSKTHTLHFPSNLSSTISGLSGYPNFGGTSGYVTLAFDLTATS